MDESGVLSLESAEATFEKEVMPEEEEKKEDIKAPDIDKGVLDNLKEKFGSFFNGDAKDGDAEKILEELGKAQAEKKAKEAEESENQDTEEVGDDTEEKTEDEKTEEKTEDKKTDEKTDETAEEPKDDEKSEEKPEKAEKEEKSEEKSDKTQSEEAKSEEDAKDDKKDEKKEEEKVKEPPKPVLKKFVNPLVMTKTDNGLLSLDGESKESVWDQLKALNKADADRLAKEKAFNDLESFIYDKQEKIHLEGWTESLSEEDKESLGTTFSEASDWLWDVEDPTTVMYEDKLAELRKATRDWTRRVEEHEKRPEAVEKFQNLISTMRTAFLETYANMTGEGLPLSQEQVFELSEKLDKADEWLKENVAAQEEKKKYEDPAFKVLDVNVKESMLFKAGDALYKKIKYWRPPKPTPAPKNETETIDPENEEEVKAEEEEENPKTDENSDDKSEEKSEEEPKAETEPEAEATGSESQEKSDEEEPATTEEPSTHNPEEL